MLTEPLPSILDVRKMASRHAPIEGSVPVAELDRLASLLTSEQGSISVKCEFSQDEERRAILDIQVAAELQVLCQRCLEPVEIRLATRSRLALVMSEAEAKALPRDLDPLLLEDGIGNLWSIAEDEVLLDLPVVAYHEGGPCQDRLEEYQDQREPEQEKKNRPFAELGDLKKKLQE